MKKTETLSSVRCTLLVILAMEGITVIVQTTRDIKIFKQQSHLTLQQKNILTISLKQYCLDTAAVKKFKYGC